MSIPISVLDKLARQEDEITRLREQRDRLAKALDNLVYDLELRASISDEPDSVAVGDGVYTQAKAILAEIEGEKK